MTTKKTAQSTAGSGRRGAVKQPVTGPRKTVPIYVKQGDSEEVQMSRIAAMAISPEFSAFKVIEKAEAKEGMGDQLDTPSLLNELREQAKAVNGGDLKQAEAMLMNQATALQSLFGRLASRGMGCDQVAGFEANMRMALRAQNQCRATLETLSMIKNPPVIYAKQANISNGPQQINNGGPSQAGKTENQINELSGAGHELLPDTTAQALEGKTNQAMEALGTLHRAKVARG